MATTQQIVTRAVRKILPRGRGVEVRRLRASLSLLMPDALRLLPMKVREVFGESELYRKNFTVALTSGSGSLASHTNLTTEPMIPTDISKVTHVDAVTALNSEGKLQRVGSESALNLRHSEEFSYYAVEDNTLYTMSGNDRTALGSTASVRAGFVPQLSSVKFQHEPLLVDALVSLAVGEEVEEVPTQRVA